MFGFWFPFILTLTKPQLSPDNPDISHLGLPHCWKWSPSPLRLWARCLVRQHYVPRKPCVALIPPSQGPASLTTVPRDPDLLGGGTLSKCNTDAGVRPTPELSFRQPTHTHTVETGQGRLTGNTILQNTEVTHRFFFFRKFLSRRLALSPPVGPSLKGPHWLLTPLLLLHFSPPVCTRKYTNSKSFSPELYPSHLGAQQAKWPFIKWHSPLREDSQGYK